MGVALPSPREVVISRYAEDVHINGHVAVWGSWFQMEQKRWGFACCRSTDHSARCHLGPPVEDEKEKPKVKRLRMEPRGKRRRRGGRQQDADEQIGADDDSLDEAEPEVTADEDSIKPAACAS